MRYKFSLDHLKLFLHLPIFTIAYPVAKNLSTLIKNTSYAASFLFQKIEAAYPVRES